MTYHPNRREQQANRDAAEVRVDGSNDDAPIQLRANTNTHDSKVHEHQGPHTPVNQDIPQILHVPRSGVIYPLEILIMNQGVLARQRLGARRQPTQILMSDPLLARSQRPVRQPEKQSNAQHDAQQPIDEEHPLKTRQSPYAVHLLEPGRHQADHGRG